MPASMYQFGAAPGYSVFGATGCQQNIFGAAGTNHMALLFHSSGQSSPNLHANHVTPDATATICGFSSPTNCINNFRSSTTNIFGASLSPCNERFGAISTLSSDFHRPNSRANLVNCGAKMLSFSNNNAAANDDGSSSVSSSTVTPPRTNNVSNDSRGGFGAASGVEMFEERVQVDRRKLEQMITVTRDQILNGRSECLTTAEEFFSRIMTRTSTQITWPTRLKIGAKTKKDPYVKVIGRYCDAQVAKEMILTVLKTRHNRVTLKMDIAFTDHSHIIGRSGRNTQQVMKETGCHIHFPDSNRNPDMEKSNMVSVAGPLESVETARRAIRTLAPLVITFEMKDFKSELSLADLNDDPLVQGTSARFGLGIAIRPNRSSGQPYCVVKGSVYQERHIKEAVTILQENLMKSTKVQCSTSLEILPSQQVGVLGQDCSNIKVISQLTGAFIHHPRPDSPYNATTFFIQGFLESVLNARRYLIGCLPVAMMFEVNDSVIKDIDIKEIEKQSDLHIGFRLRKNGETKQTVVIKGFERQIPAIYNARQKLVDQEETIVLCNEYDFMRNFDAMCQLYVNFPNLFPLSYPAVNTNMNINSALVVSPSTITAPVTSQPTMLNALPTPIIPADTPVTQIFSYPCMADSLSAMVRQNLTSGYVTCTDSACDTPKTGVAINRNICDSTFNILNATILPPSDDSASINLIGGSREKEGVLNNSNKNGLITSAVDLYSSPAALAPPTRSLSQLPFVENVLHAVTNVHMLTNHNLNGNVVGGGHSDDDNTPTYKDAPLATGLLEAAMKIQEQENAANDWKAPGAERVMKADYNRQKLLATKAMQEKAVGARVPNDYWSGFGFSRSMPAEALKNRLALLQKLKLLKTGDNNLKQVQEEDESDEAANCKQNEGEDDEEDKIGPWIMDKKIPTESNKKNLNSTNYFDFVHFPNTSKNVRFLFSDVDDLVTLLTNLQLTKYIDTFREQEIDTKTFLTMTDEDLKELGVNTFGARRKMLVAISEIKEGRKTSI